MDRATAIGTLPLKSVVPGQSYPALPDPRVAGVLPIFYQLEAAQSLSAQTQRSLINRQLATLLRTAREGTAYYRETLSETLVPSDAVLSDEIWSQVPILTRATVQEQGRRLALEVMPKVFQPFNQVRSSGSTGMPITAFHPTTKGPSMYASVLLEHVNHRVDFSRTTASIRLHKEDPPPAEGRTAPDWGGPLAALLHTGRAAYYDSARSPEEQANWIAMTRPAYLQMFPSNLDAVLPLLRETGSDLEWLHHFRTFGEQLSDDTRRKARDWFGKKIVDVYSAQEVGCIAMQCPTHDHYHLVHGMCFTEIVKDDGTPATAGEIGRVVVTDLFNPAFPLLRYDIGDYAEAGEPCDCGINWPVVTRILGRVRNLIHYPDGRRAWPQIPGRALSDALPLRQYQVVQRSSDHLQLRLVLSADMTAEHQELATGIMQDRFGSSFTVSVKQVSTIKRGAGGKFEEFRCEVDGA